LNAGKIRENLHVLGGFQYNFSGPQAGSCKRFHGQNRRFISSEWLLEGFLELVSNFIEASVLSKLNITIVSYSKNLKTITELVHTKKWLIL
jgi:hypothetical protein